MDRRLSRRRQKLFRCLVLSSDSARTIVRTDAPTPRVHRFPCAMTLFRVPVDSWVWCHAAARLADTRQTLVTLVEVHECALTVLKANALTYPASGITAMPPILSLASSSIRLAIVADGSTFMVACPCGEMGKWTRFLGLCRAAPRHTIGPAS